MKPLRLLGAHIARSPSPAMHNAALAALGIDASYTLAPCAPAALDEALADAERACRGINVTAPHKITAARRYERVLDDDARAAGAVNTVVYEDGRATLALNTDVAGLLVAWRRSALHVEGKTIGLVGAGGAARAVVVAAQQAGARGVVVHARRPTAAAAIIACAAAVGLEAVAADEPCGATLAVLASSALDDPAASIAGALAGPGAVHDLRYGPAAHGARDAALRAGHLFADGTVMLLAQAQAAMSAFVGAPLAEPAAAAMRRALAAFLRGASSDRA